MKSFFVFVVCIMMILQFVCAANVSVDGTSFDGAKLINSVTYVPLRSFSMALSDCDVAWNNSTATATVTAESTVANIPVNKSYIEAEGRYVYSGNSNVIIGGSTYVPIRSIAKVLGASVDWNTATRTAVVTSKAENFKSAEEFYNPDDLYWLSKIINAESEGESLSGKIAVGNVVLNRVASKDFPNTIYEVIFDRGGGVQFTPTANGSIYKEPNEESIIAAKICLENYKLSDKNILFFLNPTISTSMWVPNNRDFVMTIGRHDFYA